MSTHGEIKREIFKSVLRRYFFENKETVIAFAGVDLNTLKRDEYMKTIINNSDNPRIADELWEKTKEKIFNNFFARMISGLMLNEDGKPYVLPADINGNPMLSDELIDDFMSGKKISFMGAGPDDMTSISADGNELNQLLVHVNTQGRGNKDFVPKVYESGTDINGNEIHTIDVSPWSMDDTLRKTYGDVEPSENPPKSNIFQNWANRIKKFFTGRPTERWAPYEKYQKMQTLQQSINSASTYKHTFDELSPENIEAAQKAVGGTEWQKALNKILEKQKNKAMEDLRAKQDKQTEIQQEAEDPAINGPEETKEENIISEELPLQEEAAETEEEKQEREKLEKEAKQKLDESDKRQSAIENYRKAFLGKTVFGNDSQDKFYIANEKHFMSVFAPESYRQNATPEANNLIISYLEGFNEYAADGHVPFDKIDKLPEMLATVYLLGKLKSSYPDRYNTSLTNIKECPYEELPEYNQILERFDSIKKNLTTFFKKTNLPSSINSDPTHWINTLVLNPKLPFHKRFDSFLVDQGAYEAVSNKIKGIKGMPELQDETEKNIDTNSKEHNKNILGMQ